MESCLNTHAHEHELPEACFNKEPMQKRVRVSKEVIKDSSQQRFLNTEGEAYDAQGDRGPRVKFLKLTRNAISPTKASMQAAGHDLYAAYDCIIPPGDKGVIPTDIALELPRGCYGRIAPRSGLAMYHSLHTMGGVVDRDYRGTLTVLLINLGNRVYYVKKGDRVAQLILEKIHFAHFVHVNSLNST